jgi:phosphoribosyl-AMP cyclohydrolase
MAASAQRELGSVLDLKFDAAGLITAVAVDARTHEVLMVAFMNKEALERTIATGNATYWSRSRSKFWVKGEESGHTQKVAGVYVDCDQVAVVVLVEQIGAACHNGFKTCFYRQVIPAADGGLALQTVAKQEVDPKTVYKK